MDTKALTHARTHARTHTHTHTHMHTHMHMHSNVQYAGYPNVNTACRSGEQFGVQVVASIAIFVWTVGTSAAMFLGIKYTVGVRISSEAEDMGLDASEHGAWDGGSENLSKPAVTTASAPADTMMYPLPGPEGGSHPLAMASYGTA